MFHRWCSASPVGLTQPMCMATSRETAALFDCLVLCLRPRQWELLLRHLIPAVTCLNCINDYISLEYGNSILSKLHRSTFSHRFFCGRYFVVISSIDCARKSALYRGAFLKMLAPNASRAK